MPQIMQIRKLQILFHGLEFAKRHLGSCTFCGLQNQILTLHAGLDFTFYTREIPGVALVIFQTGKFLWEKATLSFTFPVPIQSIFRTTFKFSGKLHMCVFVFLCFLLDGCQKPSLFPSNTNTQSHWIKLDSHYVV